MECERLMKIVKVSRFLNDFWRFGPATLERQRGRERDREAEKDRVRQRETEKDKESQIEIQIWFLIY